MGLFIRTFYRDFKIILNFNLDFNVFVQKIKNFPCSKIEHYSLEVYEHMIFMGEHLYA